MKGSVGPAKNVSSFIGMLMLIGMFMILVVFVFNYFTDFGVMMRVSSSQLNTIDLAYMSENCLREDDQYYIQTETLDAYLTEYDLAEFISSETEDESSRFIVHKCGIRIEDGGFMVTNLETNKKWHFGYSGGDKYRHGIFVNIKEGDEIYVGQLNASIDE